ncbi:ZDHHC11 [Symbiodinium sp. CCMP2456]|nr:ZDHHC11 [Symbiodinium sp. CCMP2456]
MIETVLAQVLVTCFFLVSVGFLVVSTFRATKCNPIDPFVLRDESEFKDEELEELPFCGLCATTVQARSKHCRACNKCVASFDHHCMWLNNCIGGDNYYAFFVSISSVGVMIGVVLGTILYQFIDYFTNEAFESRLEASPIHAGLSMESFLVTLIAMSFVNVPLWCLDMQLVFLHVYLMHQNLTTYEYIMNRRQQDAGTSKFRGLPRCMDEVFSRCGQRRPKKKDKIEKIDETKPAPPDVETGAQPPELETDRTLPAAPAEAPPGSTGSTEGDGVAAKHEAVTEAEETSLAGGRTDTETAPELTVPVPTSESIDKEGTVQDDKSARGAWDLLCSRHLLSERHQVLVRTARWPWSSNVKLRACLRSGPTVGIPQVGCGCDGSSVAQVLSQHSLHAATRFTRTAICSRIVQSVFAAQMLQTSDHRTNKITMQGFPTVG